MIVREYSGGTDLDGVRVCLIELQDFERGIDPRRPAGNDIADAYLVETLSKCEDCQGAVFVADDEGELAGYVTVLTKVRSGELDDGNLEYAYVADLVVRKAYRGNGVGRQLLSTAETYARGEGARWLRISALAENDRARRLYRTSGFSELCVDFEMRLAAGADDA